MAIPSGYFYTETLNHKQRALQKLLIISPQLPVYDYALSPHTNLVNALEFLVIYLHAFEQLSLVITLLLIQVLFFIKKIKNKLRINWKNKLYYFSSLSNQQLFPYPERFDVNVFGIWYTVLVS